MYPCGHPEARKLAFKAMKRSFPVCVILCVLINFNGVDKNVPIPCNF